MEKDYRITKFHGTLIGDNRIPELPDSETAKILSSTNGKTAWVDMPTDVGKDSNGFAVLRHDGVEIAGQRKTVKLADVRENGAVIGRDQTTSAPQTDELITKAYADKAYEGKIEVINATVADESIVLSKVPTSNYYILNADIMSSTSNSYVLMTILAGSGETATYVGTISDGDSLYVVATSGKDGFVSRNRFLPEYSSAENGKFLSVVNGDTSWSDLPEGGGTSPCLNLVDFSGENPVARTSITEEEKANFDKGLYNSVIYFDTSLGAAGLYAMNFPEPLITLEGEGSFSTFNFTVDGSGKSFSITSSSVYGVHVGEKNANGTYPISIYKRVEASFGGGGGAPISVESNANDLPVTIALTDEQSTAIENQIANGHFNVNVTLSATGQKFLFNQAVALSEGGVLYYAMAMISFSLFSAVSIIMTYSKSEKTLTLSQQDPLFKNETSLRVIDNKVSLYSGDNDMGAPFGKSYSVAKINGNSILTDPDTVPVPPSYYAPETINTTATAKVLTSKSGAFEWSDLSEAGTSVTIRRW